MQKIRQNRQKKYQEHTEIGLKGPHKTNQSHQKLEISKCVALQGYDSIIEKENQYLLDLFDQKICRVPSQEKCVLESQQNKQKYIGQFKKNHRNKKTRHGLGKLIGPKGYIYIGEWINDVKQGNGIQIDEEGNRYEGQFKESLIHGFGIEKLINGDKYVGEWRHGFKHGNGTYSSFLNKETYVGGFQLGKRSGKGKLLFRSGDIFEGNWHNGLKEGKGIVIFYNGDIFKGEWEKDTIAGKCSLNYKNGDYFSGEYCQGKRKGFGTYIFFSGDKIEGEWDGNDHCIGKLHYQNGQIYEGELYKGQRNGWGKYLYLNGDIYEGQWRKDEKSGFGQLFSGTSREFSGIWSHNNRLCGQYQTKGESQRQQLGRQSSIKDRSGRGIFSQFKSIDYFSTPRASKDKKKSFE